MGSKFNIKIYREKFENWNRMIQGTVMQVSEVTHGPLVNSSLRNYRSINSNWVRTIKERRRCTWRKNRPVAFGWVNWGMPAFYLQQTSLPPPPLFVWEFPLLILLVKIFRILNEHSPLHTHFQITILQWLQKNLKTGASGLFKI